MRSGRRGSRPRRPGACRARTQRDAFRPPRARARRARRARRVPRTRRRGRTSCADPAPCPRSAQRRSSFCKPCLMRLFTVPSGSRSSAAISVAFAARSMRAPAARVVGGKRLAARGARDRVRWESAMCRSSRSGVMLASRSCRPYAGRTAARREIASLRTQTTRKLRRLPRAVEYGRARAPQARDRVAAPSPSHRRRSRARYSGR